MEIILNGVISGIVLAILVGPIFFTLVQTSIEYGFRAGFLVAVGISISDMLYITISYLGLYQITENERFKIYLSYTGGIVLLCFGVYYLLFKNRKMLQNSTQEIKAHSPLRYIGKGFIMNGLTPTVLIFWIGTVGVATTELGYDTPRKAILFFASIVVTVFTTDLIKAKLADKLRHIMTPKFIYVLNIILGVVLVLFSCKLLLFPSRGI